MKGMYIPFNLKVKLISLTRALTAVDGDVSYTGCGFKPKAIYFTGGVDTYADPNCSYSGFADGVTQGCCANYVGSGAGNALSFTDRVLNLVDAGAAGQKGVLKTLNVDGFTLTWTRAGSPAAHTANVFALCIG